PESLGPCRGDGGHPLELSGAGRELGSLVESLPLTALAAPRTHEPDHQERDDPRKRRPGLHDARGNRMDRLVPAAAVELGAGVVDVHVAEPEVEPSLAAVLGARPDVEVGELVV